MVQSNTFYKSRTVGVTSEIGLTTDRDLAQLSVLKKHDVFYTTAIPEVTWYNSFQLFLSNTNNYMKVILAI